MKTIEEKAKAYDEAIKKAESLYKAAEPMSGCNVILETIFPELKKSENEKIRKELLVFCRTLATGRTSVLDNNIDFNKWISWLEKQAERKTPQWMIDFLDDYRRKIGCSLDHDEARDVEGKILCIMQWLENQGAQKPEENKGNIGGISPTWSEEDEVNVYNIIHFLEEPSMLENNEPCKKIVIDRLKSLKGRVQPKQEWSEEDKYMYDILCGTIENTDINENTKHKLISWLKSIRPQKQWKPSEEQMEALKAMARYCDIATSFDAYKQRVVESLYSELKKLKEG